MLEEEEELDDETIQARVDASLARIYSVTSTWLKPKKTPGAPKKDLEKELEEARRRPPRLGVGAELPEKQVQSGPSELKLKNKMLGKKREREKTDSNDATVVPTLEDDEEESKSRVIRKKPKLDPFASSKKKGKGPNAPAAIPLPKLVGSPPAFEAKPEKERVVAVPTKDEDAPGPSSSKNTLNTPSAFKPSHGADESEDEEEENQPAAKNEATISKLIPNLPPVLNLHGPPAIRGDTEPSPKKKRRKKKKKKHRAMGEPDDVPQIPTG